MRPTTLSLVALLSATAALAQETSSAPAPARAAAPSAEIQAYAPEQRKTMPVAEARAILERFAGSYAALGRPRILFLVHRDPLAGRAGAKQAPERESVAEVTRLFGRPFRAAGAQLVAPDVAAPLVAGKSFGHFTATGSEQARNDGAALARVADVIVEVVITDREVLLPRVAEDRVFVVPDIHATAIRLGDSAILGQASSREVLREREPGRSNYRFGLREIAESTALALLDDIAQGRR